MKRWRLPLILTASALLLCTLAWNFRQKNKQSLREQHDQAILQSYSEQLKPGMTRKQVESYLHGKNIQFEQVCCFDYEGAYVDRTVIDPGKGDWICRSYNTYLLFQFAANGPRSANVMTDPSDTLKHITIRMIPEGCL